MAATSQQVIAGLYAAFFNRAPDAEGLSYWQAQATGGNDLSVFNTLAAGFATHPKFTDIYSGMTNQQFVEAIYINALGYEGDSEGIAFWTNAINNGLSQSDMVASFVHSALNVDLNDSQFDSLTTFEREAGQNRQDTLTNKANVGIYFANSLGAASNITNQEALDYDFSYQLSIGTIEDIDNTITSVSTAIGDIDAFRLIELNNLGTASLSSATISTDNDLENLYFFVAASTGQADIQLSNLDADVDLSVFNESSGIIGYSANAGTQDEIVQIYTVKGQVYTVYAEPFNGAQSNYTLAINSQINSGLTSVSELSLLIMDQSASGPLGNDEANGFSFYLGDELYSVSDDDIENATTYEDLFFAIQTSLFIDNPDLFGIVSVEYGDDFDSSSVSFSNSSEVYQGVEINLVTYNGEKIEGGSWLSDGFSADSDVDYVMSWSNFLIA